MCGRFADHREAQALVKPPCWVCLQNAERYREVPRVVYHRANEPGAEAPPLPRWCQLDHGEKDLLGSVLDVNHTHRLALCKDDLLPVGLELFVEAAALVGLFPAPRLLHIGAHGVAVEVPEERTVGFRGWAQAECCGWHGGEGPHYERLGGAGAMRAAAREVVPARPEVPHPLGAVERVQPLGFALRFLHRRDDLLHGYAVVAEPDAWAVRFFALSRRAEARVVVDANHDEDGFVRLFQTAGEGECCPTAVCREGWFIAVPTEAERPFDLCGEGYRTAYALRRGAHPRAARRGEQATEGQALLLLPRSHLPGHIGKRPMRQDIA